MRFSMEPGRAPDLLSALARNTTWNYVGFAANLITNFLLFPFVVAKVGDDIAGVWLLVGSLTGYMGLLELGLVPSLTQFVAGALGRRATRDIDEAASTALFLLLGLAVLALQLLWLVPSFVSFLSVPIGLSTEAEAILAVSVAGFAARMPLATLQALLLGCQRQDRCNQLWVLLALSKALATFVLLSLGLGMLAVVTMEAIVHLSAGLLQYRWVREELPSLSLAWRHVDASLAGPLLSFGGTLVLTNLCSLVIEQTDRLVIAAFLPISEVTHYSAGFKLYALAVAVSTTLVQAVAPLAGLLFGRGDVAALKTLVLRMTKYTAALALPLVAALAFAAGPVLAVWMGPRFVDARFVAQVLGIGFVVTSFNHAGYSVLIGTRRIAPLLWRYFLPQALLNLALSLWFVNLWGSVGVALGTAIPAVVLQYSFLSYLLRETSVGWREFATSTVLPVSAPAAVAFLPLPVLASRVDPTSPVLIAAVCACSLAYAALFWRLALSAPERDRFVVLLAVKRRRGSATGSS
jgi:O-antigen/teichoic acid export membrane protein